MWRGRITGFEGGRRRRDRSRHGRELKESGPVELVSVLAWARRRCGDLGLGVLQPGGWTGLKPARSKAEQLLTVAARQDAGDATVLRSLGILAEMSGANGRAAGWYKQALTAEPENYVAGTNLGTLLAASGDLEAAAALWKAAFANNQDVPELGQNLATVECRLGDKAGAAEALRAVLMYSPGVERARTMLSAIEAGTERCGAENGLAIQALP